jgi:hypothetical protein
MLSAAVDKSFDVHDCAITSRQQSEFFLFTEFDRPPETADNRLDDFKLHTTIFHGTPQGAFSI